MGLRIITSHQKDYRRSLESEARRWVKLQGREATEQEIGAFLDKLTHMKAKLTSAEMAETFAKEIETFIKNNKAISQDSQILPNIDKTLELL